MAERFAIPILPVPEDIDELGHVSNLVYLRWVAEVAMAHSRARGWDFPRYRTLGAVFMVRRHEIDYVAQVTLGQPPRPIRSDLRPSALARRPARRSRPDPVDHCRPGRSRGDPVVARREHAAEQSAGAR